MSLPHSFQLSLPDWVTAALADGAPCPDVTQRMALVVGLSARNVAEGSGGPFGAAVFGRDSGRLLAAGVNVVVSAHCSLAHAEVMALGLAQSALGSWDLASADEPLQLVASTEPCVQCFGALHWSGAASLVCGARDEDARAIGFDEGPKRDDWVERLRAAGIDVERDVLREEAAGVLRRYAEQGGPIYNAGEGDG